MISTLQEIQQPNLSPDGTRSRPRTGPLPKSGAYVAAKFGSVGLSMVLRDDLRPTGVSVLCPGTVATRLATTEGELLGRQFSIQ